MHDEEVLGKAYDARLMRRLLGYLWPYTWQAGTALAAIMLHSVLHLEPSVVAITGLMSVMVS